MVGPTGFEPELSNLESVGNKDICNGRNLACPPDSPLGFDSPCPRLAEVVKSWGEIPEPIKVAIMAMVSSTGALD